MGLFGFLKKQQLTLRLSIGEVEQWLSAFERESGVYRASERLLEQLSATIPALQVQAAELKRSAMIGGVAFDEAYAYKLDRKSFVELVDNFVNDVDFPDRPVDLVPYVRSFSEDFDEFTLRVQESSSRLSETDAIIAGEILSLCHRIDEHITFFRRKADTALTQGIIDAYASLQAYFAALRRRDELEGDLALRRPLLEEPQRKLHKVRARIAELESTDGFRAFEKLKHSKELLDEEFSVRAEDFRSLLNTLKGFFDKDDEAIDGYLADPVVALLADEHLVLKKSLSRLKKRKDLPGDVRESLGKLHGPYLNTARVRLVKIDKDREELQKQLYKNTTRMLLNEQRRYESLAQEELEEIQQGIINIHNELERLNPRVLLQRVRDALRKLKPDVEVIIDYEE